MKKLTLLLLCMFAFTAYAQEEETQEDNRLSNIDWKEDTTEVVTISDIIKEQQAVTSRYSKEKHFADVWSRRGYFNIAYNTAEMKPSEAIATGIDNPKNVPDFKSDWGVSIQLGRSYRLHKTPIANVAQFCIDYTGIDLNFNHFKAEEGQYLYDSGTHLSKDGNDITYYTPWLLEKYEANYGMTLGPSLTLAPFTYVQGAQGLHHLKFHVYFHYGYHVSGLWMQNDEDMDKNKSATTSTEYTTMKDNLKIDWGHGTMSSFGVAMTWKGIGFGYERRSTSMKYQALSTSDFGDGKYKFDNTTNRIYITFRSGR